MTSVGLVLGGGGLAGFGYHTAALAVLQRLTGWDPRTASVIVGTSAGSGVGAILSGGVPVHESLDRVLSVSTNPRSMARLRELSGREVAATRGVRPRLAPASVSLVMKELLRGPWLRPVRLVAGLLPTGYVRTDTIGDRAAELHESQWPEQPLWITAVRLDDGELVVFGRDRTDVSVATATEASSAIPAYFKPVLIDGRRYIDGGVHSANNADLLVNRRLDLVVVVSPMSGQDIGSMARTVNGAMRIAVKRQLCREVKQLRETGSEVLLVEPSFEEMRAMGPTLMDPTKVINTVLQTSSAARNALTEAQVGDKLDLLRKAAIEHPSPPDIPLPH